MAIAKPKSERIAEALKNQEAKALQGGGTVLPFTDPIINAENRISAIDKIYREVAGSSDARMMLLKEKLMEVKQQTLDRLATAMGIAVPLAGALAEEVAKANTPPPGIGNLSKLGDPEHESPDPVIQTNQARPPQRRR